VRAVHGDHSGHGDHAGHDAHAELFRRKFWVSLALTVPTVVYSSMVALNAQPLRRLDLRPSGLTSRAGPG
jgi:hypothetical protein